MAEKSLDPQMIKKKPSHCASGNKALGKRESKLLTFRAARGAGPSHMQGHHEAPNALPAPGGLAWQHFVDGDGKIQ